MAMPHKDKEMGRAWRRRWWSSLPKKRKQEKQKKANERAKLVKVFLAQYKVERGCVDCGYNKHHSALEFDHIKGKKLLNVCFAKSIAQAKKEIAKCEVVCSNCHRVRTYNRILPLQVRHF